MRAGLSWDPSLGSRTFLQKLISFRTSIRETSCGVVTMTAETLTPSPLRHWHARRGVEEAGKEAEER